MWYWNHGTERRLEMRDIEEIYFVFWNLSWSAVAFFSRNMCCVSVSIRLTGTCKLCGQMTFCSFLFGFAGNVCTFQAIQPEKSDK